MQEQSVRVFKIEADPSGRKRENRTRLLAWSPVLLIIVTSVFALVILPVNVTAYKILMWLAVSTTAGAIIGAYVLGVHLGVQRAKRQMVFTLTDKEIIRKREGWSDDRIAFSEIDALYDGPSALVVESTEPQRRISVPKEVNGFEVIRAELAKHHPLSTQIRPPRITPVWTTVVVWIVTILSWTALIIVFYKAMRPR